jgi:signal transduction histidine kinase
MTGSRRSKAAMAKHYHATKHDSIYFDLLKNLNQLAETPQPSLFGLAKDITSIITLNSSIVFSALLIKPKDLSKQLTLAGYSTKKPILINRPLHVLSDTIWLSGDDESRLFHTHDLDPNDVAKHLNWSVAQVEHNAKSLQLRTTYIVKLRSRGHFMGILVIGFNKVIDTEDDALITSIDSAKGVIAILVDGLLVEQENHRNIKKLKDYSRKLTSLDEAKDDFISMASHQLRTPLTSVKGYISMIQEGDAGHITEDQETMLNQAFASCQRMVYIISDLLNVSRIRTGKFNIDRTSVDLDYVVKDEIDQLKEIAKSLSVEIAYSPPEAVSPLYLDETKTRQVIMNFLDNALYYTPPGGLIKVNLINTEASVELRIKDNGMGVPRSEQHHLFTKFYRATNARKARPDGTGLGLFMAKKIVIAEGGAIVFDSQEGKGSTFGFIFPKSNELSTAPEQE